ncbi:hypothetical protein [Marinobacter sp. ATCH36]|uniref:hypothetical protein n=1 Tax=Marinobacter sp. ATCH36 TaxID=2945106 RepID=UPI00202105DF|nr:hypothetical protein [Marinobacter sp. ATCH36]MCL7942451.1 hypothetical protein [Marinobacter sp. ATCH36]
MMSRTAIQLAGNTSSIFQAWLDLKQHTSANQRRMAHKEATSSNRQQRHENSASRCGTATWQMSDGS